MSDDLISSARKNVEEAIERQEAERRRIMLQHRIDVARNGVQAMHDNKVTEALRAFHSYLRILENWKGVPEGGLIPSLFDYKADLRELMLISGVYWNLVKVYDRAKSAERVRDFHTFMGKYILFSKDMPFHALSAEILRKYIVTDKAAHKSDFRNAYKQLTGNSPDCFVATALIHEIEPETLPRLREFRDVNLARFALGRVLTKLYYWSGPFLARQIDRLPVRAKIWLGQRLDRIASKLSGQ